MRKKAIIIGAGLAGLSTGICLQQSGIDTEIFELAGWAGGVCTAWVRKGYRFDGCIHWMVGTKPDDIFNKLYHEIGVLNEDTPIYNSESIHIEIDGTLYKVPLQIDTFRAFLYAISPQDADKINELCDNIDVMIHTQIPSGPPSSISESINLITKSRGFLSLARKYINITVEDYFKDFQSPVLQILFFTLMPKNFSINTIFLMLGTRMSGNAGYPMGGALGVIKRMEEKYTSLGGKINFLSKVDEIVIENGKASAIKSNGKTYSADVIIAACDAYDTLRSMLKGKYKHPQLDTLLESAPLFPTLALVSFGLSRQFDLPDSIVYEYPKGIETAPGFMQHHLSLRSFDFDITAAPTGCSSVMLSFEAPLDYWQDLRAKDQDAYKNQKQELAKTVLTALEQKIPGFKEAVVVTDVATPATYVRLANLYKGSFEGFAPVPNSLKIAVRTTVPAIKNLILCGQWTTPGGGICLAVKSGKDTAKKVLKIIRK